MKTPRLITPLAVLLAACSMTTATADESSALALLASTDAALHDQAMACDELGRVGTAKAVPVLAKLLADPKLHDYARDGLERIPDPTAGKALLTALTTLKGNQQLGVIITLGDRRETAAVPALAKIAQATDSDAATAGAALTALGQIATDPALEALLAVLEDDKHPARISAARAALLAAQQIEADGRKDSAEKVRKAIQAAKVPAYLKQP